MKNFTFTIAIFFAVLLTAVFNYQAKAQVPQAFKYQSIVRNADGAILANQDVSLRLSILQGSETGTAVYTETWDKTTNAFGLIVLNVGQGTSSDDFFAIAWGEDVYYLKAEIDPAGGTNYTDAGTSQLLSVPYALYAGSSANSAESPWQQNGSSIYYNAGNVGIGTNTPNKKLVIKATSDNDTLMEILDKDGNPLMVITPQLTKFNIIKENASASGTSGGFAVGRYALAKDGKSVENNNLLLVTSDSTRVYTIQETAGAAGTSGGFAVGRYALAKGDTTYNFFTNAKRTRVFTVGQENAGAAGTSGGFAVGRYALAKGDTSYNFFTNIDSTRVFTNGSNSKKASGGFAVGRYATAKGADDNYMYMVPENYFLGHQSGLALQNSSYTGKYNTFFGYQSGMNNTDGSNNVFLGYQSGLNNIGGIDGTDTLGFRNVFLGYQAGYSNSEGTDNIMLGYKAGYNGTITKNNVFIGSKSGYNQADIYYANNNVYIGNYAGYGDNSEGGNFGGSNVYIGLYSGYSNHFGHNNVFIGDGTGRNNTDGSGNVFIGEGTGISNLTGNENVFLGYEAGYINSTGNSNVFLGYKAGHFNEMGGNNVFLGNGAGINNYSGNNNIYLGYDAGVLAGSTSNYNIYVGSSAGEKATGGNNLFIGNYTGAEATGSNNVFLGNNAGKNETASNRLYIENTSTSTYPLIYGQFDYDRVGINTSSPTANLHVKQRYSGEEGIAIENNGNGNDVWAWKIGTNDLRFYYDGTEVGYWDEADGSYNATSDKRLKKDISLYDKKVLNDVLKIKPVTYRLKHADANTQKTFGFIAQEVKEYFPELVRKGENGYYGLHYPDFGVLAIKAIQEQQAEIEQLKEENKKIEKQAGEIEQLKEANKAFEKEIKELKKLIQK